jgi:hypothetical protein
MSATLREEGEEVRAVPLERALNRLLEDLERDYIGGRGGRKETRSGDADSVIGAFAREHRVRLEA